MHHRQHDVSDLQEQLSLACRRAGFKLTHQRIAIYCEIAQSDDHPDAVTLHRRVRRRLPTVSLDTVYRTLWLLHDLGLVATLGPAWDRARFDANLDPHHHFVCRRCGFTRDFTWDEIAPVAAPEAARKFGELETTLIEVRGLCHRCVQANEKKNRKQR